MTGDNDTTRRLKIVGIAMLSCWLICLSSTSLSCSSSDCGEWDDWSERMASGSTFVCCDSVLARCPKEGEASRDRDGLAGGGGKFDCGGEFWTGCLQEAKKTVSVVSVG